MKLIGTKEITIYPGSYGNFDERVFHYKNDVYRAMKDDRLLELVTSDTFAAAVERKLVVPTTPTQLRIDGYDYVFKHKTLIPHSCCLEWIRTMRLDCLRKVIELNRLIHHVGFIAVDVHLFNFMLDKNQPVYTDVGGIQRYSEGTKMGFIRSFLNVLNSIKKNVVEKGSDMQNIAIPTLYNRLFNKLKIMRLKHLATEQLLDRLILGIDTIGDVTPTTEWSHYGDSRSLPETSEDCEAMKRNEDAKVATVYRVFDAMRPKTLIDFGCNDGYFSFLAADHFGAKVIACDIDEVALYKGYCRAVKNDSSVYFLKMDVMKPIRATGIMDECPAAWNRLNCEAGFAAALSHHVARYSKHGNVTFLRLAKILDAFIEKWLLIEFIHIDDIHLRNWKLPKNYDRDNFIESFMQFFSEYEKCPSNARTREFFLFKK